MITLDPGDKLTSDASTESKVTCNISGAKWISGAWKKVNIYSGLLAATDTLITAASNEPTQIETINYVNTHSSAITINLYFTASGGTAREMFSHDLSLSAGYSAIFDGDDLKVYDTNGSLLTSGTSTPSAHTLGGSSHTADTLANINTKVTGDTICSEAVADTKDLAAVAVHAAVAAPHTGYPLKTLLTAKGSVFVATAASTPAELTVGANTQILTVDSTTATGLKWADPGAAAAHAIGGAAHTASTLATINALVTGDTICSEAVADTKDTAAIATHAALADPHTVYVKESEATAANTVFVGTGVGTVGVVAIAASQMLGRTAAGIVSSLSAADVRTILNVADGANAYVHPNHSGDVTSVADGAQTIANDAVTYAKMQNVSATDKVLGRSTAGAGDVEEIACTAAGRALLDDANATAQLATLGCGTMALATATDYVAKSLFDAQTILAATADDTPAALTVDQQRVVGRLTGGNIAGITPAQLFYNLIHSIGITAHGAMGATETIDFSSSWQHSGTVDVSCTLTLTDPGVSCVLRLRLTKSADATTRTLTWPVAGITWANNDALTSLTQNAGVYDIFLWRVNTDTYDCSYMTMGF